MKRREKKMKNREKAITLVALVITIIILLILAGITINSLTESGLFENTKLAKEKYENAEKLENATLGQYEDENNKYVALTEEQDIQLESKFTGIFTNEINKNSDFDLSKIEKIDEDEDIISKEYVNTDKIANQYSFNVTVPYININSTATIKFNNEIKTMFKQKALDIIEAGNNNNTVYTVEYTAYINEDILSLVIRSTLKEDDSAQRIIIQTYNYNLGKNRVATIDSLLERKGISNNYAESKVRENAESGRIEKVGIYYL